jgi:hypothetical protein
MRLNFLTLRFLIARDPLYPLPGQTFYLYVSLSLKKDNKRIDAAAMSYMS